MKTLHGFRQPTNQYRQVTYTDLHRFLESPARTWATRILRLRFVFVQQHKAREIMSKRRSNKPTAVDDRARIVWMWVGGKSAYSIAQETGTSMTTVYRWLRRWKHEGNVLTRPRSGRPRLSKQKTEEPSASEGPHMCAIPKRPLDIAGTVQPPDYPGGLENYWVKYAPTSHVPQSCTGNSYPFLYGDRYPYLHPVLPSDLLLAGKELGCYGLALYHPTDNQIPCVKVDATKQWICPCTVKEWIR
ncbi:uncharacterized protein [Macrobrachium rosenbergii]|uniref:uncharacterized protein n=1 Tax=Macrobrachium rosenbergii TaxID=79674 RepID=UPI0034D7A7E5